MTRFARAKGSKASNERAPEEGTPWEVMKEQLMKAKKESDEARKRQKAEQLRIQNYENFLQERKTQKRPATWCDFPEAEKISNTIGNNFKPLGSKKKKKNKLITNTKSQNEANDTHMVSGDAEVSKKEKHKQRLSEPKSTSVNEMSSSGNLIKSHKKENKRKLKKEQNQTGTLSLQPNKSNDEEMDIEPAQEKKKKKNKQTKPPQDSHGELQHDQNVLSATPTKKRKHKKLKTEADTGEESANNENNNESGYTNQGTNPKKQNKKKTINKDNKPSDNSTYNSETNEDSKKNLTNKQNKQKAKKKKKLADGIPVRRKEITERGFQLIINGKEIELVHCDGFPIMKKDAERLAELKNSMIKKGIPKSEVQRTMKLERRRAEKALARLKRDVCYNCRKGGHNLSDCPELKMKIPGVDGADGVCFKCGSTEHRQFECKVQRDNEFRFATCFICKESGHIARQCPDNPKGLYPNGGCCKLCGDVTHMRKDCPTQNNKKEDSAVKLHTLDSTDGVEDIGLQNSSVTTSQDTKKPKKIRF